MKTSLVAMVLGVALAAISPVQAVVVPSFPTCANPQGSLKVQYSQGTHGIVGSTAVYTGSDAVYTLTDTTLLQCFCAEDGNGIQSDWWKVSSLTQDEITKLVAQGWYFIPNGSLWGLDNAPYLVRNNNFSCKSKSGGVGGGETAVHTSAPVGGSGEVLGLATTGNLVPLLVLSVIGLISLGIAFFRRSHA